MTLLELSVQYHAQAAALRERVAQLRARQERSWDENERLQLADRIRLLQAMQREAEKRAIESALSLAGGNKSKAAKLLGLSRNTLYLKMKALGMGLKRK